jgi:MoxR-like ATPase
MPVAGGVVEYAVSLARATRPRDAQASATAKKYVAWGAGPRAGQALVHAAKAKAAMAGLPTPAPAQVREVAQAVLRHRLVPNYAAAGDDLDTGALVKRIIDSVPMP